MNARRPSWACPKCRAPLDAPVHVGPFRGADAAERRCVRCGLRIATRVDLVRLRAALGASHALGASSSACPRCADAMGKWLVSRDDRLLELEACIGCGLAVLDEEEVGAAAALLGDALPSVRGRGDD